MLTTTNLSKNEGANAKWSKLQISLIVTLIISGCCSTIVVKWADRQNFYHPFVQTMAMFLGECLCLPVYVIHKYIYIGIPPTVLTSQLNYAPIGEHGQPQSAAFPSYLFLPAAMLDFLGTSLSYIGLNLTLASSFQMLRGSVVIFTGIFSVAFLGTELRLYKWLGILCLVFGLILVGLADIISEETYKGRSVNNVITGDLLIIISQILIALQVVYEQKYIQKYQYSPLLVIGTEGALGLLVSAVLGSLFYFIHVPTIFTRDKDGRLENVLCAFEDIWHTPTVLYSIIGLVLLVAIIWLITLSIEWQKDFDYIWIQILGFIILLTGALIYNDVFINCPCLCRPKGETVLEESSQLIQNLE